MRMTTKGRYAVTAMLDLALHDSDGPIALADIAERQGISQSYLEQLFVRLRRHGLVVGSRGPGGGYRLAREASDISVAEVVAAVDEQLDVTRCGGLRNCQSEQRCLTHDLWEELSQMLHDHLAGLSLARLVERSSVRTVSRRQERRQEAAQHGGLEA